MKESDLQSSIGERIKKIRKKRGMTQKDLAIACNFEKSSMSRIESGRANPTVRTLHKISTVLEIHIGELFKG